MKFINRVNESMVNDYSEVINELKSVVNMVTSFKEWKTLMSLFESSNKEVKEALRLASHGVDKSESYVQYISRTHVPSVVINLSEVDDKELVLSN